MPDLDTKINRLLAYEQWRPVEPLNFEEIVGAEVWEQHWQNWQRVLDEMKESQKLAAQMRTTIKDYHSTVAAAGRHTIV